ncbi:hypothetical protein BC835DRAFT_49414 [Cytidiella melzeri]|nr:hypothetical protein BC835DRAFT_49414 [Cytidiella melzeri]
MQMAEFSLIEHDPAEFNRCTYSDCAIQRSRKRRRQNFTVGYNEINRCWPEYRALCASSSRPATFQANWHQVFVSPCPFLQVLARARTGASTPGSLFFYMNGLEIMSTTAEQFESQLRKAFEQTETSNSPAIVSTKHIDVVAPEPERQLLTRMDGLTTRSTDRCLPPNLWDHPALCCFDGSGYPRS